LEEAWRSASNWNPDRKDVLDRASSYARKDPEAFWDWFLSLGPESRVNGSLVANVLRSWKGTAPVPKRAFIPMLRAAIEEPDPSFNRIFVEPCARAYGQRATIEALLDHLDRGTPFEKAGAANALYWAAIDGNNDVDGDLLARKRQLLLRTFVDSDDLHVRRAIIGKLSLATEDYPDEMHGLVAKAIAIARTSADEYLRHRVEIQLGKGGPLMPLPHGSSPRDQGSRRKE
jgi:hypothetical protein